MPTASATAMFVAGVLHVVAADVRFADTVEGADQDRLRPRFTGTVIETESLCFYDSGICMPGLELPARASQRRAFLEQMIRVARFAQKVGRDRDRRPF